MMNSLAEKARTVEGEKKETCHVRVNVNVRWIRPTPFAAMCAVDATWRIQIVGIRWRKIEII